MSKKKQIRKDESAWKKYKSPRWLHERKAFLSNNPMCVNYNECHNFANHVDHIAPVESDKDERFWDKSNWQALCKSCHSKKTAALDGAFGNKKKNEKPLAKCLTSMSHFTQSTSCAVTKIYITCVVPKNDVAVLKNIIDVLVEKYKKINGVNFIEAKSKNDEALYKKMFSVKSLPVIIMSEQPADSKKQNGENIKRFYDKTIFDDFEKELKSMTTKKTI